MVFKQQSELVGKYWRALEGRLISVIRPTVFASCCLAKLDSYTPTETGIDRLHFLADYISKGGL